MPTTDEHKEVTVCGPRPLLNPFFAAMVAQIHASGAVLFCPWRTSHFRVRSAALRRRLWSETEPYKCNTTKYHHLDALYSIALFCTFSLCSLVENLKGTNVTCFTVPYSVAAQQLALAHSTVVIRTCAKNICEHCSLFRQDEIKPFAFIFARPVRRL